MTAPARTFGIGRRLGFAFGLSALLAIAACIIGWLSYARVSTAVREVARVDLPAATAASQIARLAGSITAMAPLLSQSRTSEQLDFLYGQLAARLADVRKIAPPVPEAFSPAMLDIVSALEANLSRIRAETLVGIALASRNEALLREVRGLHSDFVEESEPLIDDSRILARSLLDQARASGAGEAKIADDLRRTIASTETILQASTHANLAVGLLSRIAAVSTPEQLAVDDHFLAETVDLVNQQLGVLGKAAEFGSLRQILLRLIEIAGTDSGLPHVRKLELRQSQMIDTLLRENRALLTRFEGVVDEIVGSASRRTAASTRTIEDTMDVGRNLLLIVAALAILASTAMAVTYVRGHLIRRIRSLADAARLLASGRVPAPIEVTGNDELTDMAQAMENFRRTQNELVQSAKFAALGHFSVGLAHELNQPLNAIRAQAHNALVLQQRQDGEGSRRAMEKVQALTERASLVVTHLKRFARRGEVHLTPVDVSVVVEGAALIIDARLKEYAITLHCEDVSGLIVLADEVRLEQVLVNLLSNAIDAVAEADKRDIRIEAQRSNNVVRLIVADSGPGIDPEVAATLFDPFTTTKAPGHGIGLGLAIAYNIIRDFGGSLSATSDAGGARFIIELRAPGGNG